MNHKRENVLSKIKKLLSLAEGSTFPEETASALAKAHLLMTEYKISVEALEEVEEDEPIQEYQTPLNEEDQNKKKAATWKKILASHLTKYNGVSAFISGSKIKIAGRVSDVEAVRYLYTYCQREIEKLSKSHCRGEGRTFANNFKLGCVEAIHKALQKETEALKTKYASDIRALVVIDNALIRSKEAGDWLAGKYKFKTKKMSSRYDDNARQAGEKAGAGIYAGRASNGLEAPRKKIGN